MALITCPECGNQISDQAVTCPKCGYPIGSIHEKKESDMIHNLSLVPDEYKGRIFIAKEDDNSIFVVCGSCGRAKWENKNDFNVYHEIAYPLLRAYSCKCGCTSKIGEPIPKVKPESKKSSAGVDSPCSRKHIGGTAKVVLGCIIGIIVAGLLVFGIVRSSNPKCVSCHEESGTVTLDDKLYCQKCYDEIIEKREKQKEENKKAEQERQMLEKQCEVYGCTNQKRPGYDVCYDHFEERCDELIAESSGRKVYKVVALSSKFTFSGTYTGEGYFGIEVDDYNQDFYELVANEIGSYTVSKSINVTPGETYYIEISCTSGSWSISWSGTYGKSS